MCVDQLFRMFITLWLTFRFCYILLWKDPPWENSHEFHWAIPSRNVSHSWHVMACHGRGDGGTRILGMVELHTQMLHGAGIFTYKTGP